MKISWMKIEQTQSSLKKETWSIAELENAAMLAVSNTLKHTARQAV